MFTNVIKVTSNEVTKVIYCMLKVQSYLLKTPFFNLKSQKLLKMENAIWHAYK